MTWPVISPAVPQGSGLLGDFRWGLGAWLQACAGRFPEELGLPGNGDWNKETAERIASLIPGSGSSGPQNEKDDQGSTKIAVFAVVDPYNLIGKPTSGTTCCRVRHILIAIDRL